MAIADPALGDTTSDRVARFGTLSPEQRDARAWTGAARFAADPPAAEAAVLAALAELDSWQLQSELADALPWRGSAEALADLFERTLLEQRLGPVAADVMRRHLGWPMRDPRVAGQATDVVAKDGATAGVLAAAGVVRPRSGPNAAADVIVVVSLSNLDAATWAAFVEGEHHHALALELASDPVAVAALGDALDR
jgi:hypothetical protein